MALDAIVTSTEKMLRRVIGEDIELVCVSQQPLGDVRADRGQIEQVLMNLAVNARDAMPGGGQIRIETRCRTGRRRAELGRRVGAC